MAPVIAITGMVAARCPQRWADPVGEILKPIAAGPSLVHFPGRRAKMGAGKMNRKQRKELGRRLQSANPGLEVVHPRAAGIDVGNGAHYVAVRTEQDAEPVRRFECFTADLHRMADWLEACEVKTVAMQSTGVYWIPLYEILEQRGFEVYLVDARRVKNVSGRKSDVLDCQWTQELHTYGLLVQAFRPPEEVCVLRSYLRQKEMLVQAAAEHIQHMQKSLQQMNLL